MILLDGKEYNREELLSNMVNDDFYYNNLNVKKVLSYSSIKWLLKSPKYFLDQCNKPMVETQPLRDGRLIHTQILEPKKYNKLNFIDVSSKRVKKWTEALEKHGAANTYTMKEKYINRKVAKAFLSNDACTKFMQDADFEVPGLFIVDDVPMRGKADILGVDFVADVKSTNDGVAELGNGKNQFEYTVSKYDYDLQSYMYTEMFNVPDFYWLVIDKTTTDIGIFKASKELLERGRDKFYNALSIYRDLFIDKLIPLEQLHTYKEI
jgi:hypothetical protein